MFKKRKDDAQASAEEQSRSFAPVRGAAKKEENESKDAKRLAAITAFAVTVAVAAIAYSYFIASNAESELSEVRQAKTTAILAAADIPRGTVLDAEMLKVVDMPSAYVAAGAYESLDDIVGKSTLYAIPENGQIANGMLAGQDNVTALAAALSEGYVGYTVAVDPETGVANLIQQNDRVDVLSDGVVILQDIRVAALDRELSAEAISYSTVTLELTLDQAQELQVAQQGNPVRLVLRPTTERQGEGA